MFCERKKVFACNNIIFLLIIQPPDMLLLTSKTFSFLSSTRFDVTEKAQKIYTVRFRNDNEQICSI